MEKPIPPKNRKEKYPKLYYLIIWILLTIVFFLKCVSTFEYLFLMWLFIMLPNLKFKIKFKK